MPRPKKNRRICGDAPAYTRFGPKGKQNSKVIIMTLDEYEAIRLIDHENLMQEEAAQRMNVARTTTQAIYTIARKKIASALVEGLDLLIEGGDVEICGRQDQCRGPHGNCLRCNKETTNTENK
ncbi:MAG: DUF134 domain-containing protein [Spirochaetaceae bacterium]|nr:DUF134 domain-containing protein [Spirochaetaceae bacterium]